MVAPVLMARAAWRDCDIQARHVGRLGSGQLGVAAHGRGRSLSSCRPRSSSSTTCAATQTSHSGCSLAPRRWSRSHSCAPHVDPLRGARPSRARGGARRGAGGLTGQVDVPGQHEPRDSHTVDHSARHQGDPRGHAPRRPPARTSGEDAPLGKAAADAGRGSPRLLPDRGRQVELASTTFDLHAVVADVADVYVHVRSRQTSGSTWQLDPRVPQTRGRRPRPADPGRHQPPRQRREVHTPRTDTPDRPPRHSRCGGW